MKTAGSLMFIGLAALTVPTAAGDPAWTSVDFNAEGWNLEQAGITEHLGRVALEGRAKLEGVEFRDGRPWPHSEAA